MDWRFHKLGSGGGDGANLGRGWRVGVLVLLGVGMLTGCLGSTPEKPEPVKASVAPVQVVSLQTARRQTSFVFLGVGGGAGGGGGIQVRIGKPVKLESEHGGVTTSAPADLGEAREEGGGGLSLEGWQVYGQQTRMKVRQGPQVEQLLGTPEVALDDGSVLKPAKVIATPAGGESRTYEIMGGEGEGVWLAVQVSALQAVGVYQVPIQMVKEVVGAGNGGGGDKELQLRVTVADLTLPQEPAVRALATSSIEELQILFPASFGSLQAKYLDRGDPDQAVAVGQLDALVRQAATFGVAFFVEDLGPSLHVDSVGKIEMDWTAYDRTMSPYMDGSAFGSGVGLSTWLAPYPPRRIADSPAQLKQYWQACLDHAARKNWPAAVVLGHPAWNTLRGARTTASEGLKTQALGAFKGLGEVRAWRAQTPALAGGGGTGGTGGGGSVVGG